MKAILEFNLPEDRAAFDAAHRGERYKWALRDVAVHLRDKMKYRLLGDEAAAELQECRSFIYELVPDLDDE